MRHVTPFLAALGLLAACTGEVIDVPVNLPPIADAGPGVTQGADLTVTLDGRASFDPEGETLSFSWSFDHVPVESALANDGANPFVPNNNTAASTTTFQPDVVGTYVIKLYVHDGVHQSAPAYTVVTTTAPEAIPIADAGPDQFLELGDTATLDGSNSADPLGGSLTYQWFLSQPAQGSALNTSSLIGNDTAFPTLTGDVPGYYTASLVVSNGMADSLPDSVTVFFGGDNPAPTADAGEDIGDYDCTSIHLSCAGNDPDGQPLSYFWELQVKPAGSKATNADFGNRTSASTTFWPDMAGNYQLSCSVFDGTTWSLPDVVALNLEERPTNSAPVADAGADRVEAAGEADCEEDGYTYDCEDCDSLAIVLGDDGEASDADGDPIDIVWSVVDGDATLLDNGAVPIDAVLGPTTPEEPDACSETAFTFQLSVTDCPGEVTTDEVVITAECCGLDATGA